MIEYRLVNPSDWMPSIRELMQANWAETGFGFPFNPSTDKYQHLVDAGVMFMVGALEDGEMVGYCTMIVSGCLHNPDIIMAASDALFVRKDKRGIIAGRLMRVAERESVDRGAAHVVWRARHGTSFADVLARHGYAPADIGMMKELKHGHH